MKTSRSLACILGLCLLSPLAGYAQQSALERAARILEQQAQRGKGEFVTFLMGAASAYRWESVDPAPAEDGRHYCPPPRHALDGRVYARIALEEYRRAKAQYAALSEYPLDVLALALQRGLRARYPCVERSAEAQSEAPATGADVNPR